MEPQMNADKTDDKPEAVKFLIRVNPRSSAAAFLLVSYLLLNRAAD